MALQTKRLCRISGFADKASLQNKWLCRQSGFADKAALFMKLGSCLCTTTTFWRKVSSNERASACLSDV